MEQVTIDCWTRIGVRGDASCDKLKQVIHCRNCSVYSSAATNLLEGEPPADYIAHWTEQTRRSKDAAAGPSVSVLIFRIGKEWFALPPSMFTEIASQRPVHSLPNRRNTIVQGLANIRGELIVCVSLRGILNVGDQAAGALGERASGARLLVIQRDGVCVACPVDEVHGIERFADRDLGNVPATVAGSAARYTRATLSWSDRTVGLLDGEILFRTVTRSVA
jgi:chemotaxis-related protein WspD